MGLAADLDYAIPRARWWQRAVQAVAASRPGAWVFARLLPRLDSWTARWSGGRTSAPALLAGLPVLLLRSTGRRSGEPRDTFLIAVPVGDTLALLGTNFGGPRTPAWVHNLEAEPRAAVSYRGRTLAVRARPATDAERDAVLASSAGVYAGYLRYQQRITGRRLRIFVLDPADA